MRPALLLTFLLLSTLASAQKKDPVKEFFWGAGDTYKSTVNTPEKWKNESAVIIYKNENYSFESSGTKVLYTSSIRKRVKLQDQAAVAEFSEFSFKEGLKHASNFQRRKGEKKIGIKVVKPNGTEKEINVAEEAVTLDEEKKIAIPNLEIGDIIDYYFYSVEPYQVIQLSFDTEESTLGDEYPTMNLKLTFGTENDFYVNFNTYNGAPDLKVVPTNKGSRRNYELTATDIEKNDFPRWFYPLAELPCYKFQVIFAKNDNVAEWANAFLPEKEDVIKSKVSQEDILTFYKSRLRAFGDLGRIEDFLKGKTFKNDEEKVKEVYHFMRHEYYTRYIEAYVVDQAKIMSTYTPIMGNENYFAHAFLAFLKDNKIDCDIIVATGRYNGSIEDLLLQDNTTLIVKVNTANPVYLQLFDSFTNAGKIDYNLENSNAYALGFSAKKKVTGVELVKLPTTTYKDNNSIERLTVGLSDDFSTVNVQRESSFFGHNKDSEQEDKLYFFDYVDEDYQKYGTEPFGTSIPKKQKAQVNKEFDALKSKLKEKQKENAKESAESEFGFKMDTHSMEILETGRYGFDQPFKIKENFAVKEDLLKKAGDNYVFEVGKLIGEQADLEEKELKRTNNVYFAFPRSFDNEIVFDIPAGYTVTGLDKLNKKVENSTGGFVSSAKVEGNKLIVKAYKYYANYYEPNKNWKDVVAFVDAAYQFTQEKILIKKS